MGKKRPYDPAEAQAKAQERKDRDAEVQRLKSQGASVTLDRGGRIVSAYRSNVFTRLREAKPTPAISVGQHNAAQLLIEIWAAWKGLEGSGEPSPEKVDGTGGRDSLVSDRMLRAGRRAEEALSAIGPQDRDLLVAFMVATVEEDRPMQWRGIVHRVTGEERRERQVVYVVSALENLRRHFEGAPQGAISRGAMAA
jgi:hypothetical protein